MNLLPEAVLVHIASFLPRWSLPPFRLSNNIIRRSIDRSETYLEAIQKRKQYEDLADSCLLGKSIDTLLYLRRSRWQKRDNNGFRLHTYFNSTVGVRCTAITTIGLRCQNVVRNVCARCHHHQSFGSPGHPTYYVEYNRASILRPPIFIPTARISPAPAILTGRL